MTNGRLARLVGALYLLQMAAGVLGIALSLVAPMGLYEVGLGTWLLVRGVRVAA